MRLLPLTLLAACGFAPATGTWESTSAFLVEETCGYGDTIDVSLDPFTLTYDADAKTVELGFGVLPCALSGKSIDNCVLTDDVIDLVPLNAILTVDATVDGAFADPETFTGTFRTNQGCTGTDCDDFSITSGTEYPCEIVSEVTLSFVE